MEVGDCIESGCYRLHSRFRHALVFARENDKSDPPASAGLACLVEEGLAGPTNIVVRSLTLTRVDSFDFTAGCLFVGGVALPIERRYDSSLRIGPLDAGRLFVNMRAFEDALRTLAPPASIVFLLGDDNPDGAFDRALALRFRNAIKRLTAGDLEGGAAMLCGLGRGLTPSGDDFLAGFLLGLNGLELATGIDLREEHRRICSHAVTANDFSRLLLRHASEGRCIAPVKSLVETLFDGQRDGMAVATRRLVAVGASSGADLGVGVAWAMRMYADRVSKPC